MAVVVAAGLFAGTAAALPETSDSTQARFARLAFVTTSLLPGDEGTAVVRTTRLATCGLTFVGPRKLRAGPFYALVQQAYGTWQWIVPPDVRGGIWRLDFVCKAGGAVEKMSVRIRIRRSPINKAAAVRPRSVRTSVSSVRPARSGLLGQPGGGKGSTGGYPDDGAVCRHTLQSDGRCPDYDWGYRRANGTWSLLSPRLFAYRNCTDFVAWKLGLTWSSFKFERSGIGHAANWKAYAANAGYEFTTKPSVNDIAWWSSPAPYGHVAVVVEVKPDGSVRVAEYNKGSLGRYSDDRVTRAEGYLHKKGSTPPAPDVGQYAGHIVQWDGDTKAQKTAWLVTPDLKRNWIPDIATYNCLKARGTPGPVALSSTLLNRLPDQNGVWAKCSPPAGGGGGSPPPGGGGGSPPPGGGGGTPPADSSAPSVPGGLSVQQLNASTLRMTWSASSDNVGVTGYDVYLNNNKVNTINVTIADYMGLSCGTAYTLGIAARDAAGNVSGRASVTASTPACVPVVQPPSVSMGQGGLAPLGYWYVITINNFPANAGISVTCRDTVDPGGFRTFTLTTNGSGHASTTSQCYSNDAGDHWFTANGVESNRVYWGRR